MKETPKTLYQKSSTVRVSLDLLAYREEGIAIDVVEQVHRGEDGEDAVSGRRGRPGRGGAAHHEKSFPLEDGASAGDCRARGR